MTFHTERPASWQVCLDCGEEYLAVAPVTRCRMCHGLLDVVHRGPPPSTPGPILRTLFQTRCCMRHDSIQSGVWRFQELVLPDAQPETIVSHPEGNTPLLSRAVISAWTGAGDLYLKHEGHNPTGSFKDRGMTVGVTQAKRIGATAVACASTGNTSASLASYGALAGLPALVLVPVGRVALGKLAQTVGYGARTLLVRGDFDDCLRLLEEASTKLGVYLLNSINPFRIEGQKTIVFEMLQQLGWDVPEWIVLPAGNLGNTAAFGKALREAREWGLIDRLPRIAAVQAAGAAPFAQAFDNEFARRISVPAETVATAIRIGNPASWDRAVRTIRETNGIVFRVTDEEILQAKAIVDGAGVGCEPASAASVAGVKKLVDKGTIGPEERVVAVLTGHMLKDPDTLLEWHQRGGPGSNQPIEIDASLQALEGAMAG